MPSRRAERSFAREMALWAAALAIYTLVFYSLELAFPMGLLTIAAFVTIAYRIFHRLHRRFFPRRTDKPPDGGPEAIGGHA